MGVQNPIITVDVQAHLNSHPQLLSDSSDDEEDESSDEPVHPPLLSDSEPSDDEEDESSDDEDNSPLNRYLNNRELRDIQGKDNQFPPGARVWTEDPPQNDSRMEHQEVTAELLFCILGWNEEGESDTDDVTALESLPITEPTEALEIGLGSSTAGETPSEQTQVEEALEYDEDQLLMECVDRDQ